MKYQCPICQKILSLNYEQNQLVCDNNHQFDRAKQGYFNLLPVQKKKSKIPGDSKEMINARETFLAGDFYLSLAEKLSSVIEDLLPMDNKQPAASVEKQLPKTLLDVGCGEGYYSRVISKKTEFNQYGFDISKSAIQKAAKKHKDGFYCVASSEDIPLQSLSIDLAFKVYAPASDSQLHRVIKSKGYLVSVTPAPRHLWQLREFIYDNVQPHDTVDTKFQGFRKVSSEQFNYNIIPDSNNRLNLLQMTPFAWKADEAATKAIADAQDLSIELDFIISVYQKIDLNEDS